MPIPRTSASVARLLERVTCSAWIVLSWASNGSNWSRMASTRALPAPPASARRAAARSCWAVRISGAAHRETYWLTPLAIARLNPSARPSPAVAVSSLRARPG